MSDVDRLARLDLLHVAGDSAARERALQTLIDDADAMEAAEEARVRALAAKAAAAPKSND